MTGAPARRSTASACRFYGVRHALALNSCTGGLMVAMRALGVGPGDEVVLDDSAGIALRGQGRRMSELCAAVANVQLRKLPRIVAGMRRTKRAVVRALRGLAGIGLRRSNGPEGDTGPFLRPALIAVPSRTGPRQAAQFAALARKVLEP
jgi:dTDP-4-amino-4,6-dideoxygalactose transaminase